MANSDYRYFLFSMDYMNYKNKIYDKVNKVMVLGTVNYNGSKREFSSISTTPRSSPWLRPSTRSQSSTPSPLLSSRTSSTMPRTRLLQPATACSTKT